MNLKELQSWILANDQPDSWWVAIDGEVQDDLLALPDVSTLKDNHPLAKISLLHVSRSDEENAQWETFEKESPTVFKVAKNTNQGNRTFHKIPQKEGESIDPEISDEDLERIEAEQLEQARKEAEEDQRRMEQAAKKRAEEERKKRAELEQQRRESVGDRAKEFFNRQLQKKGGSSSNGSSPAQANAAEIENLTSNEDFQRLQSEVAELKREFAEFREMIEDLKRPISEARALLEEREQFLEMSENSLFEKAQKQEVLQTELAQRAEELETREASVKQREATLKAS